MLGFLIFAAAGCVFIGYGIYCLRLHEDRAAVGFWANAEIFPVKNRKGYNCAMGKLWCVYVTVIEKKYREEK